MTGLRTALRACALVLVLGAVVGGITAGWPGALGVVAGVVVVAASYTATTVAVAWADKVNARLVLPVGMAMYVTKYSLLGAMMIFVAASGWSGMIPMAIGIVAGLVTWIGTQIWWTTRNAHPYVGPPNPYPDAFPLPPSPSETERRSRA